MLGKKEISGALEHRIDTVTNVKLSNTCIKAGLRDHLHFTKAVGSFVMHCSGCKPITRTTQKTKQIYFTFRFPYELCLI
jgi:hypothetical protein